MELTNQQTEAVVATTNDNLTTPNEFVVTPKVEPVKSFRASAFVYVLKLIGIFPKRVFFSN